MTTGHVFNNKHRLPFIAEFFKSSISYPAWLIHKLVLCPDSGVSLFMVPIESSFIVKKQVKARSKGKKLRYVIHGLNSMLLWLHSKKSSVVIDSGPLLAVNKLLTIAVVMLQKSWLKKCYLQSVELVLRKHLNISAWLKHSAPQIHKDQTVTYKKPTR